MNLRIGIDIGSTTVKVVVLDETNKLLFRSYERHFSKVREKTCEILDRIQDRLLGQQVKMVITGSAGLGVSKASGVDFVQEVYATAAAVDTFIPGTDAVIELGGEDAKIIFFGGALEERMNGSCAGGTGAFIDQDLLRVLRLMIKHSSFVMGIEDFFYWIYAGTATFMLLYELNDGGVRMYAVAGVFAGMILYDKIVSRFLFAALKKAGKWFKIKRNR